MDERFRKSERLRTREEIRRVLRQRRYVGAFCVVCIRRNELPCSRFVISVRRTVGNAVVRNRIKRRMKECFRHTKRHLKETVDIVVQAKVEIRDASYEQIKRDYLNVLLKQNLVDEKSLEQ